MSARADRAALCTHEPKARFVEDVPVCDACHVYIGGGEVVGATERERNRLRDAADQGHAKLHDALNATPLDSPDGTASGFEHEERRRAVAFSGAGKKLDAGKPRYDLLPTRALAELVAVLTFGVQKYKANGWRRVVGWRWRYLRAGLTHVFSYLGGERSDPQTKLHHLSHALCCFLFVLDNELALEAGSTTVPDGDAPAPPESQEGR